MDDAPESEVPAFRPPSSARTVVVGVLGVALGASVGVGASRLGAKPEKRAAPEACLSLASAGPSDAPSGSALASASASALVVPGADPRFATAASGDEAALAALSARPPGELETAELMALAQGRRALKVGEIAALSRKVMLLPKMMEDKATRSRLRELSQDREVAVDLLASFAALPGPIGPDLLYWTWTGTTKKSETTLLAESLLYDKDVRPKASPALEAVLALRSASTCEQALAALGKVEAAGDRRALVPMVRFYDKKGCGEKGADDCWACLREDRKEKKPDVLKQSTVAATKRTPPL